jgi:hypothetical protein
MTLRAAGALALLVALALTSVHAAGVSRQQADLFERKIATIERHGTAPANPRAPKTSRRTSVTETEINSWFAYRGTSVLPDGLTDPSLSISGGGLVTGNATVDLDAVARSRSSGRTFDIWNLVGGRMPVTIGGVIRANRGRARFELQDAAIAGVPVPRRVVQELVSYYSRTPNHPRGRRLEDEFALPAGIQAIELSRGAAVVVQ